MVTNKWMTHQLSCSAIYRNNKKQIHEFWLRVKNITGDSIPLSVGLRVNVLWYWMLYSFVVAYFLRSCMFYKSPITVWYKTVTSNVRKQSMCNKYFADVLVEEKKNKMAQLICSSHTYNAINIFGFLSPTRRIRLFLQTICVYQETLACAYNTNIRFVNITRMRVVLCTRYIECTNTLAVHRVLYVVPKCDVVSCLT